MYLFQEPFFWFIVVTLLFVFLIPICKRIFIPKGRYFDRVVKFSQIGLLLFAAISIVFAVVPQYKLNKLEDEKKVLTDSIELYKNELREIELKVDTLGKSREALIIKNRKINSDLNQIQSQFDGLKLEKETISQSVLRLDKIINTEPFNMSKALFEMKILRGILENNLGTFDSTFDDTFN